SMETGRYTIEISLDIKNAFNSISWAKINKALEMKQFPGYLQKIVGAYLSERWVEYTVAAEVRKSAVRAGVPQGSVLGPLLWNLTYDQVLRAETVEGCTLLCYADDTFIVATADNVQ
ncbi:RNA-directed DNA polymerase from mobile element jockey, partial [Harpegnathos saltator]